MKRTLIWYLMAVLTLSGCTTPVPDQIHNDGDLASYVGIKNEISSLPSDGIINIWSYSESVELPTFSIDSLAIQIDVIKDYPISFIQGLAQSDGPDALVIDMKDIGDFNGIPTLQDLSSFSDYRTFKETIDLNAVFNQGTSFDGKASVGMVIGYDPVVLYYRLDLLEETGLLESETIESLTESPEKLYEWLNIAEANGHHLFQWTSDLHSMMTINKGFFDMTYTELLSDPVYEAIYEMSQILLREGKISGQSIWDGPGMLSVEDGTMAMLILGSWGEYWLPENFPNHYKLWRVAPLPFGAQAMNGSMILINNKSPYTNELWDYLKYLATNDKANLDNRRLQSNLYFGGQRPADVFHEIVKNFKPLYHSPLDSQLDDQYHIQFSNALYEGYSFATFKETMNDLLNNRLSMDYDLMKGLDSR